MKENLTKLIKLHGVDQQLMEIEEEIGDLPAEVKRLHRDLAELIQAVDEKKERLGEIDKEKRHLNATIADAKEHLAKYQDQLLVVSTNRAYDALMSEIDTAKQTIEDSEFHLLELDEEEQRLQDKIKEGRLQTDKKRESVTTREKNLRIALAANQDQVDTLNKQREELVSQIEPRFTRTYERIRAAHDGHAMATMTRDSCGVCFNRIPPQMQLEIKARDKIITCDSCGTMLYWEGN
ncbi:MAG: hypothetical protein KAU50_09585 [Candidatus Marinimicrobia bacterium]|nr:hypothetical protein [Candidatus Neomarinimicrobiota bacterium]